MSIESRVSCRPFESRTWSSWVPCIGMLACSYTKLRSLQGRWLDRAGFAVGAAVQVLVTDGRLVVYLVGDDRRPQDCQVHDS